MVERDPDLVGTVRLAKEDWKLVTSLCGAAVGEDRRTAGPAQRDARYYWLLLAEGHLTRQRFGSILRMIAALPLPNG